MFMIVMAKEPVPGRVKTRLCPPCDPQGAADLAAAALADTLDAALDSGADEVVLALDGRPGDWCPDGVRIVPQCDGTFDRRLAHAWSTVGGPAVQIGMDTPQVTGALLDHAMETLTSPGTDAVLGDAHDGGWWIIGLHSADPAVFDGVPMSRPDTGALQRARLAQLGLSVRDLPSLTDVDTFDDALAVAALAPTTRFAQVMA
ncbi:MAG: DUF2064 domain-containing protein [Acidimicrobiales bacterium]